MLWFLITCLLSLASGFPFHTFGDRSSLGNFQVQVLDHATSNYQGHSLCLLSPFFGEVCLPSALKFSMPLQTINSGRQRCLSIPLMRAHVMRVRPSTFGVRNLSETSKEIIKEVKAEAEKERLSDNINTEVNGEEVEPENFVKKENDVEAKDKNAETKNKIIRLSEEIMEVSEENDSPEKMLLYKNFQDENISISSNLV